MEVRLDYIFTKPTDFKICSECGAINWYENEACLRCGNDKFSEEEKSVQEAIEKDYEFYREEGYEEEEIDAIVTDV